MTASTPQTAAMSRQTDPRRRMLVIVNPHASTMSSRIKNLVIYALSGRYILDAVETERQGHAIEICRAAREQDYDVVVAFGGDGTVNEAANGLAHGETPLAVLPGGATNVFCRMLGVPPDVVRATEHLLDLPDQWEPRFVDLAKLNERYFTFSAGVGFDARVVERADRRPDLKARLGPPYFLEAVIVSVLSGYLLRAPRMRVTGGDRSVEAISACVQNSDPYTYFLNRPISLGEGAQLTSGTLSCIALLPVTPLSVPTLAWRILSKRLRVSKHRRIESFSDCQEVQITSSDNRPLPLHVDGDFIGESATAAFSVAPAALKIIS